MATQSSASTNPFGSSFSPLMGQPRLGTGNPIPTTTVTEDILTTGGGARTATAAELLGGIFVLEVDDAQELTLPTATLLNAATPAAVAGATIEFLVINTGDATLTVAVGTGGTLVVGNSKSTVATVATNASKRFLVRITGVTQNGDASDAYTVYSDGSTAASVA
jgi:hypothetical protein